MFSVHSQQQNPFSIVRFFHTLLCSTMKAFILLGFLLAAAATVTAAATPTSTAASTPCPVVCKKHHTIVSKDTCSHLMSTYGLTLSSMTSLNPTVTINCKKKPPMRKGYHMCVASKPDPSCTPKPSSKCARGGFFFSHGLYRIPLTCSRSYLFDSLTHSR